MPRYYFHLRKGLSEVSDPEGIDFPDVASVRNYAEALCRELMFGNEPKARYWMLAVCDDEGEPVFDLPFLALDETMAHLDAGRRRLFEELCKKRFALAQAIAETRMTILRARAAVARSKSRPYIVAENGRTVLASKAR